MSDQQVLVTGASGFVGPYLVRELAASQHEVVMTSPEPFGCDVDGTRRESEVCDLTDLFATKRLIKSVRPDVVIHLAAHTHVGHAWNDRTGVVNLNINATSHLCQALQDQKHPVTMVYVSSGQVYSQAGNDHAQSEASPTAPSNPHAHAKLAAEHVVRSFASENFDYYIVRPFNHTGPGQSRAFVCAAIADRLMHTTKGGTVRVGNLDTYRDFTDVRDIVRAYRLLIEKRPDEKLFVLGSGKRTQISDVFALLNTITDRDALPVVDENLLREADPEAVLCDPTLAKDQKRPVGARSWWLIWFT